MSITFLIAKLILGGYWLMLAPVLFLPLGTVFLSSHALRGTLGHLLLLLSILFAAAGVILLFTLSFPDAVTILIGILAIWCLAVAITRLARRTKKAASTSQTGPRSVPSSVLNP